MLEGEHIAIDDALRLAVLRAEHAEELHAAVAKNRAYLAHTLPWATENSTLEQTREFIELRRRFFKSRRALPLAIMYEDTIVGGVGLDVVDPEARSGELGYWLDEDHQGMGLMTRSVAALLDTAFGGWKMHRIEIQTTPENQRSCAVAERLGFTYEGTKREAGVLRGEYVDLRLYALLEEEWVR